MHVETELCRSPQASYFEAVCEQVLPDEQSVVACFPKDVGFPQACFKVRLQGVTASVTKCNMHYQPRHKHPMQAFTVVRR